MYPPSDPLPAEARRGCNILTIKYSPCPALAGKGVGGKGTCVYVINYNKVTCTSDPFLSAER